MNVMDAIFHFLILISIILVVGRIFGYIGKKYFGFPPVIGELIAGMIIGPYALGSVSIFNFVLIPMNGTGLFQIVSKTIPIPVTLYMFGEMGAIFLLFIIGLETDIEKFLKSTFSSFFIALGGAILPFLFGFLLVLIYYENYVMAIFMGAILTSTSTAVTVRVLRDFNKISSIEGMAIIVASVIDDVIGVIVLALSISVSTGSINYIRIVFNIIIIMIFWIVLFILGFKFYKYIEKFLNIFKDQLTMVSIVILLLFVVTLIADILNVTIIIGAYAFGLALSRLKQKETIIKGLNGFYDFFVPIFFVMTGMIVNIRILNTGFLLTLSIIILAIIGKFLGAFLPAWLTGFNKSISTKIGVGMIPRGEVGLLIAGYAILNNLINMQIYNIAVLTTIITTIVGPIILGWLYQKYG